MSYLRGDLATPDSYQTLKSKLAETDERNGSAGNYLFYLAIADRFFGTVVEQVGHCGLAKEDKQDWRRVVVDKPFGCDLDRRRLNAQILNVVDESQVY